MHYHKPERQDLWHIYRFRSHKMMQLLSRHSTMANLPRTSNESFQHCHDAHPGVIIVTIFTMLLSIYYLIANILI